MTLSVGFMGLGAVGLPMSSNIARAGFDLMVYDPRPEPVAQLAALSARVAKSPAEAGAHGEIIQVWADDDEAVEAMVLGPYGALQAARPDAVLVIHTAVQRATVFKVAAAAQERGVGVLDAQTTTGADGARAHTLTYLIGGDPALIQRCRPVFEASGPHIFHMGELGMGVVAKCAQQAITCGTIIAVAEGMRLAAAGGLELTSLQEALKTSSACGAVFETWQSYAGMTPSRGRVYHKALRPALALAYELDVPVPIASLAQQLIPQAPWAPRNSAN